MKKYLIVLMAALLARCASMSHYENQSRKLAKIVENVKTEKGIRFFVIKVESSYNAISNLMVIAALKMGDWSTNVDNLISLLKNPGAFAIGVVGDNDTLVAATIRAALKQVKTGESSAVLFYAGDAAYIAELEAEAKQAGVSFKGFSYP